jgi:hypothetical protein
VQRYWADDEDARNEVENAIRRGGPDAVALIEQLAASAPDAASLGSLGAGPLEDLVRWEGLALAAQLDAALEREPKLRQAVRYLRVGVEQLEEDVSFVRFFGLS